MAVPITIFYVSDFVTFFFQTLSSVIGRYFDR